MTSEKYITSSCTINNGIVSKNGSKSFVQHDTGVADFLLAVYQECKFNYPKFYKMDNLSKLGWLAAEILLNHDFKPHLYPPEQVGIVLANANSSLDDDIKYYASVNDVASPSLFVYTLPNIVIGEICIRHHFKGEHALFVQETFDAGFIEGQVNYLLDNALSDACVCGWVDVLEQEYKAVLFLVEKTTDGQRLPFSKDNMNAIFIDC